MSGYYTQGRGSMPPVVKNLLIINGLFFIASFIFQARFNTDLVQVLGLRYWFSPDFEPYQIATHMFMHAGLWHIAMNMLVLWMFGSLLEQVWGGKRFLIFYFLTALGAALLHNGVKVVDIHLAMSHLSPEIAERIRTEGYGILTELSVNPMELPYLEDIYRTVNVPSVGASGAVFGLLVAYGMMFPNTLLYLYFAIPVKAKYAVAGLIVIELVQGLQRSAGDNVAHFAHLGGALFGFLIVKYWNANKNRFY